MSPGVPRRRFARPRRHRPGPCHYVIGVTDKVEVMLDHDNCGALGNEAVKHTQQHLNIERMQANRGLVEHEYGIILHAAISLASLRR